MDNIKNLILSALLRFCGKTYQTDPNLPTGFLLRVIIRRAIWLLRGTICFRQPIFVGRSITCEGRRNLIIGKYSTLDPFTLINAVARYPVVIGHNVRIGSYSKIMCTAHFSKVGKSFSIGDHSGCGEFCFFGAAGGITIGQRVIIGQYVSMHAQDHLYADPATPIQQQGTTEKGITIGDDCWIGAKATILDGTIIGNHCVIAAGAVVKGEFPDYCVIGGIPAKIIKMIKHD
jgi:acetyltransferase-like isoleucine patch superfamily enzyme